MRFWLCKHMTSERGAHSNIGSRYFLVYLWRRPKNSTTQPPLSKYKLNIQDKVKYTPQGFIQLQSVWSNTSVHSVQCSHQLSYILGVYVLFNDLDARSNWPPRRHCLRKLRSSLFMAAQDQNNVQHSPPHLWISFVLGETQALEQSIQLLMEETRKHRADN